MPSFGPACERCGCCSYEGSGVNADRCPWCHKPKRRGSREELVAMVNRCQRDLLAVLGYLGGQSILTKEVLQKRLADTVKELGDI